MKLLINMNWDVSAVTQMSEILDDLRDAGYEVVVDNIGRRLSEEELIQKLQGMDAFLGTTNPFTETVFEACPDLKIIARTGVGFETIDIPSATKHHVAVTTTPGAGAEAVSEYAMAMMLAVARRVVEANNSCKMGEWGRHVGGALFHKTLGILGTGHIGKRLADIARGFEMRIIAFDEYPNREWAEEHGVTYCETLDALLKEADFVSVHVPYMPSTVNLIAERELSLMKETSYIVNCARGGIVNEAALYNALKEGQIAGAGIDVFSSEPVDQDNPLLTLNNCVVSAHNAGSSLEGKNSITKGAAVNLIQFASGERPYGILNPEVLEKP